MITLLLVIALISILIMAHEWGHFYSARLLKIRVEEFGFGFPPKIFSKIKNGVRYSINLLPLGGFVKIYGEQGEGSGDKSSFVSRPIWQRFIVLSAGVFMNLVLAWFFFSFGSLTGVPTISDDKSVPVSVVEVLSGSPADKAGIRFGDKIIGIKAKDEEVKITEEDGVRNFVAGHKGQEVEMRLLRGQDNVVIKITPREVYPADEGPMGIALARLSVKSASWYMAPVEGLKTLVRSFVLTVTGLAYVAKQLVWEQRTTVAVSGPIGIFTMVQDSRSLGLSYLLQLAGLLSVNLAILNFLPIPALDGGRVLFLIIEKIRGKRFGVQKENLAHTIGFFILITLMVLVTYRDIVKVL